MPFEFPSGGDATIPELAQLQAADLRGFAARNQGTGVITGGAVTAGTGLAVDYTSFQIASNWAAGTTVNAGSVTLTPDPTHPRWVVLTGTGTTRAVYYGTPAPSPTTAAPYSWPLTEAPLAAIWVPANASSSAQYHIVDKRQPLSQSLLNGLLAQKSTDSVKYLSEYSAHAVDVAEGTHLDWGPAIRQARDDLVARYYVRTEPDPDVGVQPGGAIILDRYCPIQSTETWGTGVEQQTTGLWVPPGVGLHGYGHGNARSGGDSIYEPEEHGASVIGMFANCDSVVLAAPNDSGKSHFVGQTFRDFHIQDNTSANHDGCGSGLNVRSINNVFTSNVSVGHMWSSSAWGLIVNGEVDTVDPGLGWQADFSKFIGVTLSDCYNGYFMGDNAAADNVLLGCDAYCTQPGSTTGSIGLQVEASAVYVGGHGNIMFYDRPVYNPQVYWREGYRGRYFTLVDMHIEGDAGGSYPHPMIEVVGNPAATPDSGSNYMQTHLEGLDLGNPGTYDHTISLSKALGVYVNRIRRRGTLEMTSGHASVEIINGSSGRWDGVAF